MTRRRFLEDFAQGRWDEGMEWHEGRHQWMTSVEMEPVEWLWEGFIPRGMVSILTGEEGLGKSQLAVKIASEFSRGTFGDLHPDGSGRRGGLVKFFTAEDSLKHTLKPRLVANGAVMPNVAGDGVKSQFALTQEGMDELARALIEVEFGLIVVDPIIAYFGARSDSNKAQDVRVVMRKLSVLAEDTGATIIVITHPKKGEETQALHKLIGGSSAFGQAARSVLGVAQHPDEEDQRLVAVVKGNLARKPTPIIYEIVQTTIEHRGKKINTSRVETRGRWSGDQKDFESAILRRYHSGAREETEDTMFEWERCAEGIIAALESGPKTRKELEGVSRLNGFTNSTFKGCLSRLRRETPRRVEGPTRNEEGLDTYSLTREED